MNGFPDGATGWKKNRLEFRSGIAHQCDVEHVELRRDSWVRTGEITVAQVTRKIASEGLRREGIEAEETEKFDVLETKGGDCF